jgi:hypothetical protein
VRDVVAAYGEENLVEIASTAADFVATVEQLLRQPRGAWLKRVDARLATGSWDMTWAAMQAMICNSLRSSPKTPRLTSAT